MSAIGIEQGIEPSIRGHRVYRSIWMPVIDEVLVYEREQRNIHDLLIVEGSILLLNGHLGSRK